MTPITLPYGAIPIGCPVIANHCDQPCTDLVSIVTSYSARGHPVVRYLSADHHPTAFETFLDEITPLACFGIALDFDRDRERYRCVELPDVEKIAQYRDGSPRSWQEYACAIEWRPCRRDVVRKIGKDRS